MFRKNVGRLLIVVVGGGGLAVLIFVVAPMVDEPAPPVTHDEIVVEVLGSYEPPVDEGELEAGRPVPSPPLGLRDDGKEVAVIFRAAEPEAEGPPSEAEESRIDDSRLLQALSADDVVEARSVLEGWEDGPLAPVEDSDAEKPGVTDVVPAGEHEAEEPAGGGGSEGTGLAPVTPEAPAAAEAVQVDDEETAGKVLTAIAAPDAEARERVGAPLKAAPREAVELPAGSVSANGTGKWRVVVERPGLRRVEFDMPVPLSSWTPREVSHPSRRVPELAASEAAKAGKPGLRPRTARGGVIVPWTLRGVMGYRLPLVSRQQVPDQIVSEVFIPAHTTFVILKAGAWELVDVTPEELERLREAAARKEREVAAEAAAEEAERPWTLWRALWGHKGSLHE